MLPLLPTLGVPELLIIFAIVVLVFGAGKVPALGKQLGKGFRQYKKAKREVDDILNPDLDGLLDDRPRRREEEIEDAVEVGPEE